MTFHDEAQTTGIQAPTPAADAIAAAGSGPFEHSSPLFRVLQGTMPDEELLSLLRRSDYDSRE